MWVCIASRTRWVTQTSSGASSAPSTPLMTPTCPQRHRISRLIIDAVSVIPSVSPLPAAPGTTSSGGRTARSVEDGDTLHLDQGRGVPEPAHADAGHRRIVAAGEPPPDRPDLPRVRPVIVHLDDVDGERHELVRLAAGRPPRGQQVAQRLLELLHDVAPDDPAVGVQRGLPGEEDRRAGGADGVREAARPGELGWVHALDHDCTAPPSTLT